MKNRFPGLDLGVIIKETASLTNLLLNSSYNNNGSLGLKRGGYGLVFE